MKLAVAVLSLLAALPGCTATEANGLCGDGVIESPETCDDGNVIAGDGCSATCQLEGAGVKWQIGTTWSLQTLGGFQFPCPTGFQSARVVAQPADANGVATSAPAIRTAFTCEAAAGDVKLLANYYLVSIEITDAAGTGVFARSLPELIDITTQSRIYQTTIYSDAGYLQFAWKLVGAATGNTLTCAQAGADTVELITTASAGGNPKTDTFTCDRGIAISQPRFDDTYTASIDATLGGSGALGAAANVSGKVVAGANLVTDIGMVTLMIDGK
jgi:cysteine-rich repeat protein